MNNSETQATPSHVHAWRAAAGATAAGRGPFPFPPPPTAYIHPKGSCARVRMLHPTTNKQEH